MEPLNILELIPRKAWGHLSCIDCCGPLSTGEYLVVIIDEYSRYLVTKSVSANTTIPVVDMVPSKFGYSQVIKTCVYR